MSQAFMREKENEWLGDVSPNPDALINYLTRENNGIRVYEIKTYISDTLKKEVYEMSNGMTYVLDDDGRWSVL